LAQLTRIARDPSHSPFIVAIAWSASARSLPRQHGEYHQEPLSPPEREETITPALARVHIPHDPRLAQTAKCAESLVEDLIIDFWAQIAHKHMEMMLRVLFVCISLIRPIDSNIGIKQFSSIKRLESLVGCSHIRIFDESIVHTTMGEISILDNLGRDDGTGDRKDLGEHVVGYSRREVADVEMGFLGRFSDLTGSHAVRCVCGGHRVGVEKCLWVG
jgi:hypothetical protein